MTTPMSSRRMFLHAAGLLSGGVFLVRYAPGGLLEAFQGNSPDAMRTQIGAAPIETTKLADRLTMFSGPGGNVVVLSGPAGKIVVVGFVKPAWPRLKAALDALNGSAIQTMIDPHSDLDHAGNDGHCRAS